MPQNENIDRRSLCHTHQNFPPIYQKFPFVYTAKGESPIQQYCVIKR
jgi:hypothetical protein